MFFSGFVATCSPKWRIFVSPPTFNSSAYSLITEEVAHLSKTGLIKRRWGRIHWRHEWQLDPTGWVNLRVLSIANGRTSAFGLFISLFPNQLWRISYSPCERESIRSHHDHIHNQTVSIFTVNSQNNRSQHSEESPDMIDGESYICTQCSFKKITFI